MGKAAATHRAVGHWDLREQLTPKSRVVRGVAPERAFGHGEQEAEVQQRGERASEAAVVPRDATGRRSAGTQRPEVGLQPTPRRDAIAVEVQHEVPARIASGPRLRLVIAEPRRVDAPDTGKVPLEQLEELGIGARVRDQYLPVSRALDHPYGGTERLREPVEPGAFAVVGDLDH